METKNARIFQLDKMDWLEVFNEHSGKSLFDKRLVTSGPTGMIVNVSRYPAGYVTTWHTHTHAHGMYVIEGKLYTNLGIVEPGNFVWFPQGEVMEHGATEQEDCTVLFITDAAFDITYVEPPKAEKADV